MFGTILQRRKRVQVELEKAQVEIPEYRKRADAAEESKITVLDELVTKRRLLEDLKHGLEKAATEEKQAKQDSELAQLRMKEVKQGVTYLESIATKTQLEVERGRHSSSVEELVSVNSELETLQKEYASLIKERDVALKRAEEENSKSKEIERNVEEFTLELIALKGLLDSSHATHVEAEEVRINAALDWEKEKLTMEKEIEQGELQLWELSEQVARTNELESKLGAASDLLVSLRAEFFTYMEGKFNQELPASAEEMSKKLEEIKKNLEKTKDEVQLLRVAAASLKIDLEKEKEALEEARKKESLASLPVSSLEEELNKVNAELSKVTAEKEARNEPHELTAKVQQASEEAEDAKSLASLAREELKKFKEETEEAKAAASAMEMRLQAVLKEIEVTKSSEELAASALASLKESDKSEDLVTLGAEEYHSLCKMAREAEDLANKRVILAIDRIQEAKESESSSLQKLEKAKKEIEERKKALKLAVEKAEMAQEAKLAVEQELRTWREENEQRRKAIDGVPIGLAEITNLELSVEVSSPKVISGATCQPVSPRTYLARGETRNSPHESKVRRSFFPRLIMFLARKKVQTLKS